jgi:hypothetical protein
VMMARYWLIPASPVSPAHLIQPTSVWQGQTAREAYVPAEAAARGWAGDAQLVMATATWPPGSNLQAGAATWTFTFFSAERQAIQLVSVIENRSALVSQKPLTEQPERINVESWQTDSHQVISRLLALGGHDFMNRNRGTTVILSLTTEERLGWEAVLFGVETGNTFSIMMDAETGEVVSVQSN